MVEKDKKVDPTEEPTLIEATKWKDEGNQFFKNADYEKALESYTKGLDHLESVTKTPTVKTIVEVLLTNRAAVYLKTQQHLAAYNDCNDVLKHYNKLNSKALYRSAQAVYNGKLKVSQTATALSSTPTTTSFKNTYDYNTAIKNLSQLLHIEPKNQDAINLIREIRTNLSTDYGIGSDNYTSPIMELIKSFDDYQTNADSSPTSRSASSMKAIESVIMNIIGLVIDDKSHAMDLGRIIQSNQNTLKSYSGLIWLNDYLVSLEPIFLPSTSSSETLTNNGEKLLVACQVINKSLRCLTSACMYPEFVMKYVDINGVSSNNTTVNSFSLNLLNADLKISFYSLCSTYMSISKYLYNHVNGSSGAASTYQPITVNSISLVIQILKNIPLIALSSSSSISSDNTTTTTTSSEDPDHIDPDLYLTTDSVNAVLSGLMTSLLTKDPEIFSLASEAFTAFISDAPEYLNAEKPFDARMETLEDRKKRFFNNRMLKLRSTTHAICALKSHYIDMFLLLADSENALLRQRSGICIARLINAIDNEELVKSTIQCFIDQSESIFNKGSIETGMVNTPIILQSPLPIDLLEPFLSTTANNTNNNNNTTSLYNSSSVIVSIQKNENNQCILLTCHPMELMRRRALLESALLSCSNNDLGVWVMKQPPLPASEQDTSTPTPNITDTTGPDASEEKQAELLESLRKLKLPNNNASNKTKEKNKELNIKYTNNGVKQLLMLISSNDIRCQEVASETMCLAAQSESGSALLSLLVSSGALTSLLKSPSQSVRAAAASTMTKLSIKAKALDTDSPELSHILNTVLTVLKSSPLSTLPKNQSDGVSETTKNKKEKGVSENPLVSFSKLDSYDTKISKAVTSATSSTVTVTPDINKQKQNEKLRLHAGHSTASDATDFNHSLGNIKDGATVINTERAIEVLASLIGKTYIKEEIVHGSYRVAPSLPALLALDLDMRSTAAYGLAHILSSLTVSNHELRAKALAEKDMTQEQYDKLMELQRIKTKDEHGNVIEEKKDEGSTDSDTPEATRERITKIVQLNGIQILLKLIENGSHQTKDKAAIALRQILSEDKSGSRGLMIQQGGLKTITNLILESQQKETETKAKSIQAANKQKSNTGFTSATSGVNPAYAHNINNTITQPEGMSSIILTKPVKLELSHCIAKTLITTNPLLLTEHLRLSCISSLIFLCRDVDADNLKQFEALLAITNLTSCGEIEQNKLAHDKGVSAVHYLMFSDHKMVRRAATEALTNMSGHDSVLKFLRDPEQVRLWLGLMEEYDKDVRDLDIQNDKKSEVSEENIDIEIVSEGVKNLEKNNKNEKLELFRQQLIIESEPYKTARAACATLAMAATDVQVVKALIVEKVAETYVKVLNSKLPELIHRILVSITEGCTVELQFDEAEYEEYIQSLKSKNDNNSNNLNSIKASEISFTKHLIDNGILPAIAVVIQLNDPTLGEIAKGAANIMSQVTNKNKTKTNK